MGYDFDLKLVVTRFLKNKNSGHTPYERDYSPGLIVVFSFRAILPWGFIFLRWAPSPSSVDYYDLLL